MPGTSLRDYCRSVAPPAELTDDDGRWVASIPGTPFVSEGTTIDGALEDLIDSLREYAEDWEERLQHAPNHQGTWALVQLVELSSDAELREWLGVKAASPMRLSIEAMACATAASTRML